MYKKGEKEIKRDRKNKQCLFYETQGGPDTGELSNCIAYAKGSLHNGDPQRAERVVIRNMG